MCHLSRSLGRVVPIACLLLPLLPAPARADEAEPRVEAGTFLSPAGALLYRDRPDRAWQTVAVNDKVYSRDWLMALPGSRATFEPQPNSVTVTLWGNVPKLSSFDSLQSELVLHDTKAFDLDFTAIRGQVVIRNNKARGPAKVWVRLPHEGWELTLAKPGDEAAVEMFGRWPRGVPYRKEARFGEVPMNALIVLVLKGQAELKTPSAQFLLEAPPGPAVFQWDSLNGPDRGPQRVDRFPDWADAKAKPSEDAALAAEVVQRFQKSLKDSAPSAALVDLFAAADKDSNARRAALTREIAVLGLGALDDLDRVTDALSDEKHPEMRDAAVTALRHWIGSQAGRDARLYLVLENHSRMPAAQAETVMQMLHSPFASDLPETYETLIAYLQHRQIAVRELAHWHLVRLAPAGRDIKFDAGAAEADRNKGIDEWKKLIPRGQLPPKEKPKQ
jgi:hypothetical protein